MKITLAGLVLADAAAGLPPLDLKLNGVRVIELADFARAASKGIFTRGNSQNSLTFAVSRVYGSFADAQDAFFTAESAAPLAGALLVRQTAAAPDRPPVGATTAAIQAVAPALLGVRVDFAYTIQTGRIVGGAALPYVTDPDAVSTMLGATNIPAGQDFVAVNFPANLPNPIVGGVSLVAPAPGVDSPGIWKIEQLTAAGFVAYLTGVVPGAGFSLHWTAKAGPNA